MSKLVILTSEVFKKHRDPLGNHPERPERLDIAIQSIRELKEELSTSLKLSFLEPEVDEDLPLRIHDPSYVELVKNESNLGPHYIDADTYVNEHTYEVAVKALSLVEEAVKLTLSEGVVTFALVRPPGHHAGVKGKALGAPTNGFCIFNNAALAVYELLRAAGRVVVVDFDAHHGNGTQEIYWENPDVLHIDTHEEGIYPGTGYASDVGTGAGEGTKINIPLPPYPSAEVLSHVVTEIIPKLIQVFKAKSLVVSAGFDSHYLSPLASLGASDEVFETLGKLVNGLTRELNVPTVVVLEGGYADDLKLGLKAFLWGLVSREGIEVPRELEFRRKFRMLKEVYEVIERYWLK